MRSRISLWSVNHRIFFQIERNGVAEIWDVAIDNRKDAEAKLREEFDSDIQILSAGELTKAHVAQRGLEPGRAEEIMKPPKRGV